MSERAAVQLTASFAIRTRRWRSLFGCCLALLLAACSSKVELISQVTEMQANDVIAALSDQGIEAVKVPGKDGVVSVQVADDKIARAIEIMRAAGLPREPYASLGEVFKKDGLISSPTEEHARMVFALSQELSRTISKIDGVIFAQVHVVLPEQAGFGETSSPSSAAVFIKHEDTADLVSVVPQIRRLVANSIPGLSYDKVSVQLVPSAPQTTAAGSDARLDSVWSIQVAAASAGALRVILGVLTLALLAACAGVGVLLFKAKRSEVASG
ncbi:type III secretion system inner membrane ring lipoprotein SctJ [Peristeroidobacter soli]|uniref:type III secretion system inner membrane ring lipoprotein SctJ n=1 Tax=Peristeroidobacter soli TaxID=2497877 RepID=UPI001FE28424|nr:type III secretion inner membrane ring lipoprotein SctJ [Peristeroidobacter soli]